MITSYISGWLILSLFRLPPGQVTQRAGARFSIPPRTVLSEWCCLWSVPRLTFADKKIVFFFFFFFFIIIIILVVAITFTTMMMIMVIATMRSEFCIVVLCSTDDLFQHISTILHLSQPDCSVWAPPLLIPMASSLIWSDAHVFKWVFFLRWNRYWQSHCRARTSRGAADGRTKPSPGRLKAVSMILTSSS